MNNTDILEQNKTSWDCMADDWFGTTALPAYGCLIPNEDELHLFGEVTLESKKTMIIINS